MPRFSGEEEYKIYEIARKHLMATDSNVTEVCMASIVWRQEDLFIVVVWANRDVPSPDWDQGNKYYEQYNYHVAMKVVFKSGQRFLRVAGSHLGANNTWLGKFECYSCKYDLHR